VAQAKQHKRLQEVQQRRHGQQQTHTGACRRLIGLKKSACKMLGSPSAQQQPPCTWAHIVNSKAPAIHRLESGGLATGSNAPTSTQLPWLLQTRHEGFLGLVETIDASRTQAAGVWEQVMNSVGSSWLTWCALDAEQSLRTVKGLRFI
jgi:hypothetical protein